MSTCARVCDCNVTLANTGVGCTPLMKVVKRPWIMPVRDSLGALNYIDLAGTLDNTYFAGLINQADSSKRLYPLPEIKNITDARDKPTTFTWKDGTEVFIRTGVRKFEGMFPPDSASPQLNGTIETFKCGNPGFFGVDADGTIWGKISSDGTKLYPVIMDAQSIAATFTKPTDTEPQMMGLTFNFHPTETDCQLRGLVVTELVGGIDPLSYDGLVNVYAKVISCTITKLVIKLYDDFGTALNPRTVKNLVVGDFSLTKVASPYTATPSAVLLTGTGAAFSESSGTYSITYKTSDDPSVTDHLALTPTKAGFDFTSVKNTVIVVA